MTNWVHNYFIQENNGGHEFIDCECQKCGLSSFIYFYDYKSCEEVIMDKVLSNELQDAPKHKWFTASNLTSIDTVISYYGITNWKISVQHLYF